MTLTNQDAGFTSGDHFTLEFTIFEPDGVTLIGDITGFSFNWDMAESQSRKNKAPFAPTRLLPKSIGSGITIVDGPNSRVDVIFVPTDTDDFGGEYYHELQMKDLANNKTTAATGILTIKHDLVEV